jgi:hypothetical protein
VAGVYINNLGEDSPERIAEAYGAEKLERLVAMKDRWGIRTTSSTETPTSSLLQAESRGSKNHNAQRRDA